jgi:RNA polymerase primary sigma factor
MSEIKITNKITNRDSLSIELYLKDISKIPRITADEEVKLGQLIRSGDEAAVQALVKANLRFVVSVAKKYEHMGLSLPDLISEGNIGLMTAARRYDETRGFKFISYAVTWIKQTILLALADKSRMVRRPQNKITSAYLVTKTSNQFEQENERPASVTELCEILGMNEYQLNQLIEGNIRHTSLDAPVGEEEDMTVGDKLFGEFDADTAINNDSLHYELSLRLRRLGKREADVLKSHFGFGGNKYEQDVSLQKQYGLSPERLRQLREKALTSIRKAKDINALRAYLG